LKIAIFAVAGVVMIALFGFAGVRYVEKTKLSSNFWFGWSKSTTSKLSNLK